MRVCLLLILVLPFLSSSTNQNSKNEEQKEGKIKYKNIEFISQGATLRGRLYLPDNKSEKSPVVIMAHGFTTTIDGMTTDKYAEKFRDAGFAAILYDHRNLGISDGEPRQEINFWIGEEKNLIKFTEHR